MRVGHYTEACNSVSFTASCFFFVSVYISSMGGASKMGPLHCFYLIIVMLSIDINMAQDSQGQCTVAKRYRVR